MASSDGTTNESNKAWRFLRTSAALTSWSGTLILRTMSDLAERISETAFPELEGSWSPSPAGSRPFIDADDQAPDSIQHILDEEDETCGPYAVEEDGRWYVLHTTNLRQMLQRMLPDNNPPGLGHDPELLVEMIIADFEIEMAIHGDEGDHPEILGPEVAQYLTPEVAASMNVELNTEDDDA